MDSESLKSPGKYIEDLTAGWQMEMEASVCERCDWSFLSPKGIAPFTCPHCFKGPVSLLGDETSELPYLKPPELLIPFKLQEAHLTQVITRFTHGVPFPPTDLNPHSLIDHLKRLYLPLWLVDAKINARWGADAGFNYEVLSHQDHYDRGGWVSHQVKEERVRWEPRLGSLRRSYQNISAPALEEHRTILNALGSYALEDSQPYRPEALNGACTRLPNRTPQDAWNDAIPLFQRAAAEECRQATTADHIHDFNWQPEYQDVNWTLLLLPLYATYYQDDEGLPQPVYLNGQSGHVYAQRKASMKGARKLTLILLGVSAAIFLISLLLSAAALALPALLALGVLGITAAMVVGLAAIYPVASVWWYNRNTRPSMM
jgi:hypothetical protein